MEPLNFILIAAGNGPAKSNNPIKKAIPIVHWLNRSRILIALHSFYFPGEQEMPLLPISGRPANNLDLEADQSG
jgi:hypothetical protein